MTRIAFVALLCGALLGCASESKKGNDKELTRKNEELQRENERLKARTSPAELLTRNEQLESENQELARKLLEVQGEIQNRDQQLSELRASAAQKEEEVTRLADSIAALQGDIDAKKKRLAELDTLISSQEGDLTALNAERTKLQGDLTTLESQRTELSLKLDAAEKAASELTQKVTTLEQSLSALEAERARLEKESASVRDFTKSVLLPYEGLWLVENDPDSPLPEGCHLFFRIERDPVGFMGVALCEDGRKQIVQYTSSGMDSVYHAETSANAMRLHLKEVATSCPNPATPPAPVTNLLFLNFVDGFGEPQSPSHMIVGNDSSERYFRYGGQVPELFRNARCDDISARALAPDAKPLLKLAAEACSISLENAGTACVDFSLTP